MNDELRILNLKFLNVEDGIAYQVFENTGLEKEKVVGELEMVIGEFKKKEESVENPKYWKVPKAKMNFSSLLKNIYGYSIGTETKTEPLYNLIMDVGDQIIGKLPLCIEGLNAHEMIVYSKENQEQIKSALELRDIFDLNNIQYEEEPHLTEVLEYLKRPAGDSKLIKKIERKIS